MSLTKATYSMITGAPVNVLDYGADPTGVADSTGAIQAAIDVCAGNSTSKTVVLPGGKLRYQQHHRSKRRRCRYW